MKGIVWNANLILILIAQTCFGFTSRSFSRNSNTVFQRNSFSDNRGRNRETHHYIFKNLSADIGIIGNSNNKKSTSKVLDFYDAWNNRDIDVAAQCFTEDATYEDTQFPRVLNGREEIKSHFMRCSKALPKSFRFAVDDIAIDEANGKVGVRWHVEDDETGELPFTRGSSFYTVDTNTNLIQTGFDVVEPAVVKPGDVGLNVLSLASKIISEPVRAVPLTLWVVYMYVVFFSTGIIPGANALELEQRTWEEVFNLSLNFFFVSPLLNLPFAPVVHPGLEGIFNLLLSWAALFGGFLSDEREEKKNTMPMLPTVIGMQFLTSAFLLPYLATRESEDAESLIEPITTEKLNTVAKAFESKLIGPFLGFVGGFSMYWGLFGRSEFGSIDERFHTLVDLLSIDRVGSSFIIDLIIFALFQGWLVDDDLRRRGIPDGEMSELRFIAKFVPFFGTAIYLFARPSYNNDQSQEYEI